MSRFLLFAAAFIVLLIASAAAAPPHPIGEPFDLIVGESVMVGNEGLKIGFDRVSNDSRCPADAYCVWEGDAEVLAWADAPGEPREDFDLHTNSGYRRETVVGPYVIRLLGLVPYPRSDTPPDPDKYVMTAVVLNTTDDLCGSLVPGVECLLFQQDFGGLYVLDTYGEFHAGDRVCVNGSFVVDCETMCMQGNGCIKENSIVAHSSTPVDRTTWGRIKARYGN